jgi:YNFM family putative membrane transporter
MLTGLAVFSQLYFFQPLLPALAQTFSISPAISSLAISAGTAGMAVGLFIFAFWADQWSRKMLMSASMLGTAVLTIVSAAAPNFAVLVGFNFMKGMVISATSAVSLAYLSEEVEPSGLGVVISLYFTGNILGGMSGRVVAGLIEGWAGWRAATLLIGIAGLLIAVIFHYLLPSSNNFKSHSIKPSYKFQQMKLFLYTPSLLGIFMVGALIMGVFISCYNYLNFRLEEPPFSLPHYIIASVYVMYMAGIAGSIAAGRLSDRYHPQNILKLLLLVFTGGVLLLLTQQLWVFILGLGILTFGFFASHTVASRIISEHSSSGKSTATSLYWLFYYIGSSVIGTGSGFLLSSWGWTAFIFALIAIAVTSVGCVYLAEQRKTLLRTDS